MRFQLGRIPVRVHAAFLVMTLVLASSYDATPTGLGVVAAIMALSVLAHELGHALMGRAFGLEPAIDLHGMGGLTSWTRGGSVSHGRRVLISLAGPGVGLVVCLLAGVLMLAGLTPTTPLGKTALTSLFLVNGLWSVFNLIPMLPLDGGAVALHALNAFTGGRGERPARVLSLVVSVLVALASLRVAWWWVTILATSFAIQNATALRRAGKLAKDEPLQGILAEAVAALQAGDARTAIARAEAVVAEARSGELRVEALRVLAYAFVADGRWSQLLQLLGGGLSRAIADDDLARFEQAARESGSHEAGEAIAALRHVEPGAPAAGDFNAG